eukprot:gene24857-210_t
MSRQYYNIMRPVLVLVVLVCCLLTSSRADCGCKRVSPTDFNTVGKDSQGNDCQMYLFGYGCGCGDMFSNEGCDGCLPSSDEGCSNFDVPFERNESAWIGCYRDPNPALLGKCVMACQDHHCVDAEGVCWPCNEAGANGTAPGIPVYQECHFQVNGSAVCEVAAGNMLLAVWDDAERPTEVLSGRNITILTSVDDNPRFRKTAADSRWVFKFSANAEGRTALTVRDGHNESKMDVVIKKQ